ncbi:MAG TPA: protein-L-isoaspartate O-methyltransferase, partial [Kofleriaceae bacterium]|nr:protein-L-isoaspartate O-methyltransferase [Kofleriaceae bacterium]
MARALLTNESRRQRMVSDQLRRRDIVDPHVLAAFGTVERERFVPGELGVHAYDDAPLPIGAGQTISQPYVVAMTVQALQLKGHERVLEIGTGSGYQAAVLSELARE